MWYPLLASVVLLAVAPVNAQSRYDRNLSSSDVGEDDQQPSNPPSSTSTRIGNTASTGSGEVGQRQTRGAAPNFKPLDRIDNRIANRVQSRIRNRIDRTYDPQSNAASPFEVAGERTKAVGQPRR